MRSESQVCTVKMHLSAEEIAAIQSLFGEQHVNRFLRRKFVEAMTPSLEALHRGHRLIWDVDRPIVLLIGNPEGCDRAIEVVRQELERMVNLSIVSTRQRDVQRA